MEVLGCGEFLLRFGPLGGKTREISFLFFELRFSKKKKKALSQLGKMQKPGEGLENGYCGMSKVAAKKKDCVFP